MTRSTSSMLAASIAFLLAGASAASAAPVPPPDDGLAGLLGGDSSTPGNMSTPFEFGNSGIRDAEGSKGDLTKGNWVFFKGSDGSWGKSWSYWGRGGHRADDGTVEIGDGGMSFLPESATWEELQEALRNPSARLRPEVNGDPNDPQVAQALAMLNQAPAGNGPPPGQQPVNPYPDENPSTNGTGGTSGRRESGGGGRTYGSDGNFGILANNGGGRGPGTPGGDGNKEEKPSDEGFSGDPTIGDLKGFSTPKEVRAGLTADGRTGAPIDVNALLATVNAKKVGDVVATYSGTGTGAFGQAVRLNSLLRSGAAGGDDGSKMALQGDNGFVLAPTNGGQQGNGTNFFCSNGPC